MSMRISEIATSSDQRIDDKCPAVAVARDGESRCYIVTQQRNVGGMAAVRNRQHAAGAVARKGRILECCAIDGGKIQGILTAHSGDGACEAGRVVKLQRSS